MSRLLVLNGPNLNLLGSREPGIYGNTTLAEIEARLRERGEQAGIVVECLQSNAEHELVDRVQAAAQDGTGYILINPAAFTHTSVAILDALNTFDGPVIEVHISNVHKREAFRHHSYVSLRADAVMAGFGTHGYLLALRHAAKLVG